MTYDRLYDKYQEELAKHQLLYSSESEEEEVTEGREMSKE
jgi:hypothetical protein